MSVRKHLSVASEQGRSKQSSHTAPSRRGRKGRRASDAQTQAQPIRTGSSSEQLGPPVAALSPLSLERLSLIPTTLRGVPTAFQSTADSRERHLTAGEVRGVAHLIGAGILPPLPPQPSDTLRDYFKRLSEHPVEGEKDYPVMLTTARDKISDWEEEMPENTLEISAQSDDCLAWNCTLFKERCRPLHPRFFGSLMVHLSEITGMVWPVLTNVDALALAARHYGDGDGFTDLWREISEELISDGQVVTRQALRQRAEGILTQRKIMTTIGVDECLPALKKKLCFSLAQLRQFAQTRVDVLDIIDQLEDLKALNQALDKSATDNEIKAQYASGNYRVAPVALLSGQKPPKGRGTYIHLLQELAEEEWQWAAQDSGWIDNLTLHVVTLEDAQRAKTRLQLFRESYEKTQAIVHALADAEPPTDKELNP